ncbi:uncharacterized protein LOC100177658 isoform X2 [Ciona intestinalis]
MEHFTLYLCVVALALSLSCGYEMKIVLRFAIYFDNDNEGVSTHIEDTLSKYVHDYGLSESHVFEVEKYKQENTPSFADILESQSFSAVILACRRIDCDALSPYFHLIPFFQVTGSSRSCDQDLTYNRIYYLMPSDSGLMATFFKAVKQYEWESAAVLYDKNDEVQFTFQDIQEARTHGLDVVAFEEERTEESTKNKLIQARRKGIRTYVLVSSYTRLIQIMSVARRIRLSTENYHWFIPNVLLNPQVLHDFLNDGVRITFLHSPLVTPLTLAVIQDNPELQNDGDKLFLRIIELLVRTAAGSVVEMCKKFKTLNPASPLEQVTDHHGNQMEFCGFNISESLYHSLNNVSYAALLELLTIPNADQVIQVYTTQASHGGHMTTTTPSGHGHMTTTTPLGHGHMTTTTPSGHGHMTTTTSSGHGHMTTTTPSGHGHMTTTTPSGHGHMTTTTPSGHGHMTTTTPSGHGHMTTTTPSGHGHMTTTTPSGHGHMTTTTPSGHGHMTTTTPSGHGHMTTTTPPGHGHMTTTTPSGHGHMTTTTPSGQGHMTTTTPSGHGHMTTTTPSGHGHMTTTTPPPHAGMTTTTPPPHAGMTTTTPPPHAGMTTTTPPPHAGMTTTTPPPHAGMTTTTPPPHAGMTTTTPPPHAGMTTTTPPPHAGMTTTTPPPHAGMTTTTPPPHAGMTTTTPPPHAGMTTTTPPPHAGMTTTTPPPHAGMATTTPPPHAGMTTTTPPPHAGMTTTTPPPHAGMTTTTPPLHAGMTTTTPPPHAGMITTTPPPHAGMTTTTPPPHAGMTTTTPPPHAGMTTTTPPPHAGMTTTTPPPHAGMTTTTPMAHGRMATTTTPSGHGHMTTTTPSGHGHMTTTTSSDHGHMTTTTPSGHGHMTAATPASGHGSHETTDQTSKDSTCLISTIAPNIVNPPFEAKPTTTVAPQDTHSGGHSSHHSSDFEIVTSFDPCPFLSRFVWGYNHSNNDDLVKNLDIADSNSIYTIEHVHGASHGAGPVHQLLAVGGWNGARSYIGVTYPKFAVEAVNLPKRDLVLGVVWNPPWLSWEVEDGLPVPGSYKGYLYDVITKLSDLMGFTFVIHNDTAVKFGKDFNDTDEVLEYEMNKLFEDDICDIFLYDMSIYGGRLLRSDTVSITSSFMTSRLYFLTQRVEKNHAVSIWQFLAPFQDVSWVVLWTSLVAVCLLMTYINKRNPYEFKRAARDLPVGSKHSDHLGFLHSMWFNFASLVEQSSQLLPKSASLKLLAGTWWFYVMLVVAAYTANMISFMTQVNSGGITTLTQLASQSEVKYGFVDGNPMLTKFLPRAKESPYSLMWDYVKKNPDTSVLDNLETGLSKVRMGDYILIASYKDVVNSIAESCVFDKVGAGFYPIQSGLPVRRGMIFLPAFNDHIAKLRDTGILHDLELKWFANIESHCELAGQQTTIGDGGQLDLKKDHHGFQKPGRVMDDEFVAWPGGWDVLKHKPFISQQQLGNGEIPVNTSNYNNVSKITKAATTCCPECGQEEENLHKIIKKRKQSSVETTKKPIFVNTVDDTISLETGYRSNSALSHA